MNDPKVEVRGMSCSAQPGDPEIETPSEETASTLQETEMEMSEMPRRRIAGKRTVEEDAHVHAKKGAH